MAAVADLHNVPIQPLSRDRSGFGRQAARNRRRWMLGEVAVDPPAEHFGDAVGGPELPLSGDEGQQPCRVPSVAFGVE